MKPYKLVVLGDNGVGKSALTIQLCLGHFVETYDPTIEDSYRKQVVVDDEPLILEVLDTVELEQKHKQSIRDGEGFLLVYSVSSLSTFERISKYRDQIAWYKDDESISMMLVGNKCDQITEREVSQEENLNMARRIGCEFIESSAKNCVNVVRAFYTVVRMIRANRKDGNKLKRKKLCLIL
ncbi:6755_t:CDS:1 [Ambispora gerdemannii]|uniref:6755_t:CDS:1 n=1 Tax=Ambispora gerdemannii TaxID=144530 RepID=A0A9N9DV11_9GLOM|nr:6755_t:CDS:1 [Ambispora gerdemannii]